MAEDEMAQGLADRNVFVNVINWQGCPQTYRTSNRSRLNFFCPLIFVNMVSIKSVLATVLVVTGATSAKLVQKTTEQLVVTYLGTQGPILSSGAWTSKGIVYTSGTVPTFNGSIIAGGIEEQTVRLMILSLSQQVDRRI